MCVVVGYQKKKENTSVIHFLGKAEKAPEKGKQK